MPITKSRLDKRDQKKYLACLQELRSKGCDVEIPDEWLEHSRALDITVICDGSSTAIEGVKSGAHYAVRVRLVANQPGVILVDSQLKTEWDNDIVLESFQRNGPLYKLGHMKYPAGEVLNDRIEDALRLIHHGPMVEGVILFSGLRPIPEQYRLGMSAPFKLAFWDQFGAQMEMESKFCVVRETKRQFAEATPGGGLHGTAEEAPSQQHGLEKRTAHGSK